MGLGEVLRSYNPDYAHTSSSLRELLCKKNSWLWTEEHQREFEEIKTILADPKKLGTFDPSNKTKLITDVAKKAGVGFLLIQIKENGEKSLIHCGSRATTGAMSRYSTYELDL